MGALALGASLCPLRGQETKPFRGIVMGEPKAAEVGSQVLQDGGNAIDAIVAGALVAGINSPNQCGIGGYGGHMVLRMANGKIACIDFNSTAPSGATAESYGWLAAGVPGTLAGLQLALDRYGTRPFKTIVAPAIALAESGVPMSRLTGPIRQRQVQLQNDPASARLYFSKDDTWRNPDLAKMLARLAKDNSVRDFYEGEIAGKIADAFAKNGGLVTRKELASFKALDIPALHMTWKDCTFYTPPVTAGGITVLQAFGILKELPAESLIERTLLETMRLAWQDRLERIGDGSPSAELLTPEYCRRAAERVKAGIAKAAANSRPHRGTVHLNAADSAGNVVALTLTHGNAFGACVTVEGLGLTLGHGMSRFDPDPKHPNGPGAGKRPLTNMCPTLVLRGGKPVLALGAAGGRLIVNTVFQVLWYFAGGKNLQEAIRAPRWHTEGGKELRLEQDWPKTIHDEFAAAGYEIKPGGAAVARAIAPQTDGTWQAATR